MTKRVLLAKPRGYCAGVDRAVVTVEKALQAQGAPVYVRKEIVHNRHVVETLQGRGVVFVDEADEVPEGATVSSPPMAYPRRCTGRPRHAICARLTPHARW
jgi:4-hydroxy-3-methylbut-2-enyl diphosphate reductase